MWEKEIGQKYGRLTVLSVYRENRNTIARCRCSCGREKDVRLSSLKNGNTTSCGCSRRADLTGQRFGRLVVLEYAGQTGKRSMWKCRCDCGNITVVRTSSLKSGNTKSCGCGMKDHPEAGLQDQIDGTRVGSLLRGETAANTSGKVGVSYHKRKRKWYAEIIFQKKRYSLGYFDKFEDACDARRVAEDNLHKSFLDWYKEQYPDKAKSVDKKISAEKIKDGL